MYKKNEKFFLEESGTSSILYNNENNEKIFVLNELGSFIFHNIDKYEVSDIITKILSEYDVDINELNSDVANFIANLEALNIIIKC